MKKRNEKGSALVLVLTASIFLIVLTAGAFRYFQTNVATQIWTRERIQAKLSAEAGVNLSTHMLMAGAALPISLDPEPILGNEASYFILPGGMGSVYATVDPSNSNPEITTANAYMIRCIANVQGSTLETFGMEAIVMPENLARFAVFQDDPASNGYYADGYRFDGPFYANGPVNIFSSSVTHENDVFFYSYKTTASYWVYGRTSSGSHQTTPAAGNLEMRPFQRLLLGPPYFELNADTIPFGSSELDWQGVRSAASSDGLSLNGSDVPDMARLLLQHDTLFVKKNTASPPDTFPLGDLVNPVVWIENDDDDIFYLRGSQTIGYGLDMALTIGCNGHIFMSGLLNYENNDLQDPDNTDMLGLISVHGNMIIADSPDVPDVAWGSYQILTEDSFIFSAVLVALEGKVESQIPEEPIGEFEFRIQGGYMCQAEGHTNYEPSPTYPDGRGFAIGVYFDPRLLFSHPPFFPTTANWNTTMWAERAEMTQADVTNGSVPEY